MDKKIDAKYSLLAICERIDTARVLLKYTKKNFAKQVFGVSKGTYHSAVSDKGVPLAWVLLLANDFDFSLDWLIYGKGEIFNKKKD